MSNNTLNTIDYSKFPVFQINQVSPLLQSDNQIFCYSIKAMSDVIGTLSIRENKGLDLTSYIGSKMEWLVEITKAKFHYEKPKDKFTAARMTFRYCWSKRTYEFFPELIEMKLNVINAKRSNEKLLVKNFEDRATELVDGWGLSGLGLSIYQDKPVLTSTSGIFLLNEYVFEDELKYLNLNDEVYIEIEELFLRGAKPLNQDVVRNETKIAQKNILLEPEKETIKDDPDKPKRRKFFNLD